MATTNAGNSQSRENKPKFKTDRPQGERKDSKDFKGKSSYSRGRDDRKNGEDSKNRGDFKGKSEFKAKGGFNKNFDRNTGFGKDKDEDDKPIRRPKQTKIEKPKEQQPDKIEIINRLEKEKKAMKKKHDDKKEQKVSKHQVRPKRSGNVDWTREYENGSYDDDDLDMYFR